ncbi:homoserine kinase [Nakamurella sp. PAMC28650]|uniref:homoserine kinase n=1 Tax=Nakamurella sp. PAMC28650 TaxID=2762325 RepID=UPI00164EA94D|nr:homoserine kinase [Nakamurella sp. PAMC28650]QNK80167.1 homoserine kinase [Nakamurella sp. PAMC28650]
MSVTVRVPATSANLGPGYDCFGLALQRYDEASAALHPGGLRVEVEGAGAGEVPTDATHLVVQAMAKAWAAVDLELPSIHLRCRNCIPHGGGQGSSAAAIVTGLLLGRALLADPARLSDDAVLQLANEMEGHPDNVAPALLGGFTLAWTRADSSAAAVRLQVHPDIRAVIFSASKASSTHHSRTLLPQTVPHAAAAANSAAAALMVHAMTVDPGYLLEASQDRLHQPYRASSMPESAALMDDLRGAGIAAVISGAGPSVLALVTSDMDLQRWQRRGFAGRQVPICDTGATITES